MTITNEEYGIPQGAVVSTGDGLIIVGDGPDLDEQYRVVRLFCEYAGPGFEYEENLTNIVGYIKPDGAVVNME